MFSCKNRKIIIDTSPLQLLHSAFSHPQQGRIDFNTVNPSLPTGMDFLSIHLQDLPQALPSENLSDLGRRGWVSQYLPSFGGVRTFSSSSIHLQGWIRKSILVGREGLTVLKPILPCREWENERYWKALKDLKRLWEMTWYFCFVFFQKGYKSPVLLFKSIKKCLFDVHFDSYVKNCQLESTIIL